MDQYLGLKLMFMDQTFGLLEDLEKQCRVDIEAAQLPPTECITTYQGIKVLQYNQGHSKALTGEKCNGY